jgi:hypothetical protein
MISSKNVREAKNMLEAKKKTIACLRRQLATSTWWWLTGNVDSAFLIVLLHLDSANTHAECNEVRGSE